MGSRAFFMVKDAYVKHSNKTTMTKNASSQQIPERLDIRVDWAFQYFFSEKEHLIKIIKDLLDLEIEVIEYLPNRITTPVKDDKKSVFDVICKNSKTNEIFVLEMQTTYESDMMDRLYYYGGSLIHNQMKAGQKKYVIKSVIVCCIASYRVPHKQAIPEGKVFFRYRMLDNETHEPFDGDKLNYCFLELQRFDNYLDKNADLKKQWCWIFNNLATFVERPANLDSSFDAIIKDADTSILTADQQKDYMKALELNERERQVVYEGGYEIGMMEGMEKGTQQRNAEIAKNLLAMHMSPNDIAKATGLTEEQILALK